MKKEKKIFKTTYAWIFLLILPILIFWWLAVLCMYVQRYMNTWAYNMTKDANDIINQKNDQN